MEAQGWLTLIACAGQLFIAIVAFRRVGRSPVAMPLGLLCVCVFTWTLASTVYAMEGDRAWKWVDRTASPFTMPLLLHVVLAYAGRVRRLRRLLVASYAALGLLSLASVAAALSDEAADLQRGYWTRIYLLLTLTVLATVVVVLVQEIRGRDDVAGRRRAALLLLTLTVATPLGLTELFQSVGVPRLGFAGVLLATTFFAVATLRLRLFGRDLSTSAATQAAVVALLIVASYVAMYRLLVGRPALLVLGTATAVLALSIVVQRALAVAAERRARSSELATLGRFAAQMAHDLKNPLATIKGAVQYLGVEREAGRPLDPEFVQVVGAQVARMERSIADYQRLGRVDPVRAALTPNDLVTEVTSASSFKTPEGVELRLALEVDLPELQADADLLARALENLVENALRAMPSGGTLTIGTALDRDAVLLSVEDTGEGMDAATAEHAFEDFFTTRAGGSGLGLPFVRRVAEAHGGEVILKSRPGKGTTVAVRLPLPRRSIA